MHRFDSDLSEWLQGPSHPPNATCSNCHRDFYKGRDDDGSLCDRCCYERDQDHRCTHCQRVVDSITYIPSLGHLCQRCDDELNGAAMVVRFPEKESA